MSRPSRFADVVIRPSVILSLFATIHFAGSILFWSIGLIMAIQFSFGLAEWLGILWQAFPAIALFIWSLFCLFRSIRQKKLAITMVMLLYVISGCAFCYDVAHERSQVQVGIATAEYWENGNPKNTYFTWWWYNDGWFR